MSLKLALLFNLGLIPMLVACQQVKSMDEMKDSTAQIRDTSKDLKETSGDLYDDLRQGDAKNSREASLRDLIKARAPSEKVKHAAHYFMSFEYQLWTGFGKDDGPRREQLQAHAAREFVRTLQGFAEAGQSVPRPFATRTPFEDANAESDDQINKQVCLNALAASMHLLNPKQELRLKLTPGLQPMSMMKMLDDAVRARFEIKEGRKTLEQFPPHVHELLSFPWVVDLALQARYNFLAFSAIYSTSDLQKEFTELSIFGLKTITFHTVNLNFLRKLMLGWTPQIEAMTDSEIRTVSEYLTWGIESRKLLEENGVQPILNSKVQRLLNKISLTPEQIARIERGAGLTAGFREAREAQLIQLFHTYSGLKVENPIQTEIDPVIGLGL